MSTQSKPPAAGADRTIRHHFDEERIRLLAYPFLRDLADVLLTANGAMQNADELLPSLTGADQAVVDAIRDSAWTVGGAAEQMLARILVGLWQPQGEFRDPHATSGPATWEPCGARVGEFVVTVTPGVTDGMPQDDTEDAEVTVTYVDSLPQEDVIEFMRSLPQRMVELEPRRAKIVTPEELAEAALA